MMIKLYITFILLAFSVPTLAQVTLTMGGDVNFNKNLMKTTAEGFTLNGITTPWSAYTRYLKPLIDGTLNFANIETVVSSRNDLPAQTKKFVFQTHPKAIQHLVDVGFNFLNLANNHTYDFGHKGMGATIEAMQQLKQENDGLNYFGIGYKKDLLKPTLLKANGFTIAVASLTILDKQFRATDKSIGVLHIWDTEEYRTLVKAMKETAAHYKILSIHFGTEGQVGLDAKQKSYYEYAIANGDVDLIIGHHPHAVRPIQKIGDKYIFYSLGNYLMLGSANITKKDGGADFGLFSKLHLVQNEKGRLIPEAIELVPLTNTHSAVKPMAAEAAEDRLIDFQKLIDSQLGNEGIQYKISAHGRGYLCHDHLKLESSKKACSGN